MTPPLVSSVALLRERLAAVRRTGRKVGLVPTMGALHAGHAAIMERARAECDFVVASIFVNPLQFGPSEDYSVYPRPLEMDLEVCAKNGVDLVFAPGASDMYAAPQLAFVEVTQLTEHLCGAFRPGHFRGVATVVLKLFNIVQPDVAFFGEKDFQQLCVIRRMVEDFNLPLAIVPIPTVREADGLALSSRNAYLEPAQRAAAPALYRTLGAARALIEAGETDVHKIKSAATQQLGREPLIRIEYFEIVDPRDVQPMDTVSGTVRIAAAIWIGKTRLIDNVGASSTFREK